MFYILKLFIILPEMDGLCVIVCYRGTGITIVLPSLVCFLMGRRNSQGVELLFLLLTTS